MIWPHTFVEGEAVEIIDRDPAQRTQAVVERATRGHFWVNGVRYNQRNGERYGTIHGRALPVR